MRGLVSVNSYLIQDIAKAALPLAPSIESSLWYQYYFQTERGRAGLTATRREIARTLWIRNSPSWRFDEATLDRHASAFENPDYNEQPSRPFTPFPPLQQRDRAEKWPNVGSGLQRARRNRAAVPDTQVRTRC